MKNILNLLVILMLNILLQVQSDAQARLVIENNSIRDMTVKVMRNDNGEISLHEIVSIKPYISETVFFSETGNYFTKTKAVLSGKDPVYRKGELFNVYNGRDGYSMLTITFTIKETAISQASGGKSISKKEFDQD
jgi:hypothetical protein